MAANERLVRASYALLGVGRGAALAGAAAEARAAYLRKAAEAHPDRGGDATTFQLLKDAYDVVLKDLEEREADDSHCGTSKVAEADGVASATYKSLGADAFRRGEYVAAARHFADALDAREDAAAPLHANRSAALLRAGNARAALDAALASVDSQAEWAKGHFRAGEAYAALGDYARAVKVLTRAAELEPTNKTIAKALTRAREDAAQKVAQGSLARTGAAAEVQPSFGAAVGSTWDPEHSDSVRRPPGAAERARGSVSRRQAAIDGDPIDGDVSREDRAAAGGAEAPAGVDLGQPCAPAEATADVSGADSDVSQVLWPLDIAKLRSGAFKRCKRCNTIVHCVLTVCPGCSFHFKQRCRACTAVVASLAKRCTECGVELPKLRAAEPARADASLDAAAVGHSSAMGAKIRTRAAFSRKRPTARRTGTGVCAPAGPPQGVDESDDALDIGTDSGSGSGGESDEGGASGGEEFSRPHTRAEEGKLGQHGGSQRALRGWDASLIPHYAALGAPRGAGEAAVRARYRALVAEAHPHLGGEAAEMCALVRAYDAIAADAASAETAGLPPPPPGAIFVAIASYRDAEARFTVADALQKATNPDLLYFGIAWQAARELEDQYRNEADHSGLKCLPEALHTRGRVRELRLSHRDAEGAAYARALLGRLWNGEEYALMVDSHTRFVPGWDATATSMLAQASERCAPEGRVAVLTTQPLGYRLCDDLEREHALGALDEALESAAEALRKEVNDEFARLDTKDVERFRRLCVWSAPTAEVELPPDTSPTVPCAVRARRDGLPHIAPRQLAAASVPDKPIPTLFWAPQLSFSRAEVLFGGEAPPFSPHLPYLSNGDELLVSCRLWCAGCDFFAPQAALAYHCWDASYRPAFEREAFMTEEGEHRELARALREASAAALTDALTGEGDGGEAARSCGLVWGEGEGGRTPAAFMRHCGVDLARRKLAPHARTGGQEQVALGLQRQAGFLPS